MAPGVAATRLKKLHFTNWLNQNCESLVWVGELCLRSRTQPDRCRGNSHNLLREFVNSIMIFMFMTNPPAWSTLHCDPLCCITTQKLLILSAGHQSENDCEGGTKVAQGPTMGFSTCQRHVCEKQALAQPSGSQSARKQSRAPGCSNALEIPIFCRKSEVTKRSQKETCHVTYM